MTDAPTLEHLEGADVTILSDGSPPVRKGCKTVQALIMYEGPEPKRQLLGWEVADTVPMTGTVKTFDGVDWVAGCRCITNTPGQSPLVTVFMERKTND